MARDRGLRRGRLAVHPHPGLPQHVAEPLSERGFGGGQQLGHGRPVELGPSHPGRFARGGEQPQDGH